MTNNKKLSLTVLLLCGTLTTSGIFASDDCATLINTDKNTFLNKLKVNGAQIYKTLHSCAQNNFCASYSGVTSCLPTLNNYTADAAYYAAAQHKHLSNAVTNLSSEQQQTLQQSLQASDAAQQVESAQPKIQEKKSNATSKATEKKEENSSNGNSGGIYDNINF